MENRYWIMRALMQAVIVCTVEEVNKSDISKKKGRLQLIRESKER